MSLHKFSVFLLALLFVPAGHAQQKKPSSQALGAGGDRLGLTCAQMLQMTSTEWVAKFQQTNAGSEGALRAIAGYGKCYDARTDRLAGALGRSGKRPLMGAPGDFQDFDKRLLDFTAKALAASEPPADIVKSAYAELYEKQFRYEFYESYEQRAVKPAAASLNSGKAAATTAPPPSASQVPVAPAEPNSTSTPGINLTSGATSSTPLAAGADVPPIARAKNRFGELLGLLPDEKAHALHAAFGDVFGNNQVSEATRLEVYEYAIYLLEPLSPTPYAPPPF
jgi:hypothetical protein